MSDNTNDAPLKSEEPEVKSPGTQAEPADNKKTGDDQVKNDASDSEDECNDKVPFPAILHEIVSDPATDHCIHWLPNGNLFTISDKKKFAKEVLPKLNGHAKFTSFTRRLKRWGFSRIASGPQIGAYQNPDFIKEDPDRTKNIKYMLPKPLSMTAIHRQKANLQGAKMNAAAQTGAFGAQSPPQDLRMLQTLLAQQQQMGMQPHNMATAVAGNQNMAVQLAMLQNMQNQQLMHQIQSAPVAAPVASTNDAKSNESFGEKLIRTNPSLAAQLIEAKSMNMMSPQGMAAAYANPMMAMFAAQENQMQLQGMNPALPQQVGNQGGDQQNLTAMMFALLQQEQQQQQLQQQKDFIQNFMRQQGQSQARATNQPHRGSISDSSLLVTPSSSAPSLHANLQADAMLKQGSPSSDENWLSALLKMNSDGNQGAAKNPDDSGNAKNV